MHAVTQFLRIISMSAVFPPWRGASSEKCLLLWRHFVSKQWLKWRGTRGNAIPASFLGP